MYYLPRFNLIFLLTTEGKFNYHGIKKWIEEHSETTDCNIGLICQIKSSFVSYWNYYHSYDLVAGKVDLDDVQFAICLDSIGKVSLVSQENNEEEEGEEVKESGSVRNEENQLFVHVSRPPKEGQATFDFLRSLERVANKTSTRYDMIHKKINLANDMLAWEHERFSLNKIPAMTISHFHSYKDTDRATMTDTMYKLVKHLSTLLFYLILIVILI